MLSDLQNEFYKNLTSLIRDDFSVVKNIGLAVSSGPDSTAMMILIHDIINIYKIDIDITVFIVDHNLRSGTIEEVEYIKDLSDQLNFSFYSMQWNCYGKYSNLQARARLGRYDLITSECNKLNIRELLTGHHQDDIIENFLIRKLRKSSVLGLSTHYINFYNNVRILRPMFSFNKSELVQYLLEKHVHFFTDASNYSMRFQRNRIRHSIDKHTTSHAIKSKILDEISCVNTKANILNNLLIEAVAETVKINNLGFAIVNFDKLRQYHHDIITQTMIYIVSTISRKKTSPRYRNIKNIIEQIFNTKVNIVYKTLHGCIIKKEYQKILIYKEQSDINCPEMKLNDLFVNNQIIWDRSFLLSYSANVEHQILDQLCVGILLHEEYLRVKDNVDFKKIVSFNYKDFRSILFTIPVIRDSSKNIIIPHINYCDISWEKGCFDITFQPNFIFRFTHFLGI
ncbi:tRNA lysidine(34) synthetase TilS [Rickettsia endosymbiont of Cardiosporidium cionae]|uniref:tRNA lysidine(34) synthetase TilS n=1 Tax=Rickettsia endosymbiont of Cardiosporidium cionae TaxID=2777155 RepID=UPI0018959763|nr:tRNA lysidine(34) synthetase TilS [Rickettsia endosymbiont of Cardiosporidium cionae]KAF8818469.1 tRNA(Ile)-lysidine synthetase [Rickettsia endosymbiont of Cardiosporidium cionae]